MATQIHIPDNLPAGALLRALEDAEGLPKGSLVRALAKAREQESAGPKSVDERPVVQGSRDAAEIRRSAETQELALRQMAEDVAREVPGAKVEGTRVKDANSQANKDKRGKPAETNIDNLGARVSAQTPEMLEKLRKMIEKRLPVVDKDRITSNGLDAHQYAVKTGEPGDANQVSELQVVSKAQAVAMKKTDPLYDEQKNALARGDKKEAARLGAEIEAIHKAAEDDTDAAGEDSHRTADREADATVESEPKPASTADRFREAMERRGGAQFATGDVVTLKDGRVGVVQHFEPGINGGLQRARVRLVSEDDGPGKVVNSVKPKEMTRVIAVPVAEGEPWTGVDMDGTLAQYDGFKGVDRIGPPITAMVDRVKRMLAKGKQVRIFTARISADETGKARSAIEAWSKRYLGVALPITDVKDAHMEELWDDRAVQVEANTGKILGSGVKARQLSDSEKEQGNDFRETDGRARLRKRFQEHVSQRVPSGRL